MLNITLLMKFINTMEKSKKNPMKLDITTEDQHKTGS